MGTRPEIIKFAPLISALGGDPRFAPTIVSTGQHKSMNEQTFSAFSIDPDHELALMKENQTPNAFLSAALSELEPLLAEIKPQAVIVQGDTTSALAGALAAFHLQIPFAHLEAGLRTFSLEAPFPEEMNRSLISRIAKLHFCPTKRAAENLKSEGLREGIHVTGNTVVDAVVSMKQMLDDQLITVDKVVDQLISNGNKLVLVTGHRRENFDGPLQALCHTLRKLHDEFLDISIVYPVHRNPKVQDTVLTELQGASRIHLLNPLNYPSLLSLIQHSILIITDSGGIQEEAPTFGTPVLVTRCSTERPEAIETDCARLCPLDNPDYLFQNAKNVIEDSSTWQIKAENPFGDGQASQRIKELLADYFI